MTVRVALTYRDYAALPDDGKRYEIHDGELCVTAAPAPIHQVVSANLFTILRVHVSTRGLGLVLYAPIDDRARPYERGHEQRWYIALGPPDLDEVAKPRGGQQRHPRPAPLEDRVGADRGPMHEPPHRPTLDAERRQPSEHGRGLVERLRRNFPDPDVPRLGIDRGHVGERPADVDSDDEHARRVSSERVYRI